MPSTHSAARSDALAHVARLIKIVVLVRSRRPAERLGRTALAQGCECVPRTIGRDISLLEEAGIPIEYDRTLRSYTLPDKGWVYPIATLTPEDALGLALAHSLLAATGVPHQAALLASLGKTTAGFTPTLKQLFADAAQAILPAALPRDYSAAPLDALLSAAGSRQTVEIDYESRSAGARSWRALDPYAVEPRDGLFWELHGWCHRREEIRTFALDGVRGVRPAGGAFQFRTAEWEAFCRASGIVGGLRGGPPLAVDVLFLPPVAGYARTRRWPAGLTLTPQADGTARLTGQAQGADGLVTELLRWRRHCRVDGGPELRARMVEELREIAMLYQEDVGQPPKPVQNYTVCLSGSGAGLESGK